MHHLRDECIKISSLYIRTLLLYYYRPLSRGKGTRGVAGFSHVIIHESENFGIVSPRPELACTVFLTTIRALYAIRENARENPRAARFEIQGNSRRKTIAIGTLS